MNKINEASYPTWVKVAAIALTARLASLNNKLRSADDINDKLDLLGKMTAASGYISGLGIAIETNDKRLLSRLKTRGLKEGWAGDSDVFVKWLNEVDDVDDEKLVTLMKPKKEKLTPAQKYDADGDGKIDSKFRKKVKR